ncbi:MFS transporter [Roseovarius sp. C7]|uniref:MFS transporter n=1 Tax=Roseovarius sp. C7 TaxID=3398643 RepID=UPI0039F70496
MGRRQRIRFIALPLYALYQGFSAAQASGALVAAMIAGGVVQYPIGWISDNTDRRYVVIGLCAVAGLAAVWMAVDTAPARTVWGFAIIGGATLPIYSILAAHANDQLTPGQVVPASGTMAFLQQFGQVFGMLLGPNLIAMGGGRGLQGLVIVVSLAVILIAVARRVRSEAPEDTGEVVHFGALGLGQAGVIHAETVLAEAEEQAEADDRDPGPNPAI